MVYAVKRLQYCTVSLFILGFFGAFILGENILSHTHVLHTFAFHWTPLFRTIQWGSALCGLSILKGTDKMRGGPRSRFCKQTVLRLEHGGVRYDVAHAHHPSHEGTNGSLRDGNHETTGFACMRHDPFHATPRPLKLFPTDAKPRACVFGQRLHDMPNAFDTWIKRRNKQRWGNVSWGHRRQSLAILESCSLIIQTRRRALRSKLCFELANAPSPPLLPCVVIFVCKPPQLKEAVCVECCLGKARRRSFWGLDIKVFVVYLRKKRLELLLHGCLRHPCFFQGYSFKYTPSRSRTTKNHNTPSQT